MSEKNIYEYVASVAKELEGEGKLMMAKDLCNKVNQEFGTKFWPNRYGIYRILHNAYQVAGPSAKAVAERALNSIIHNITKVVSKGENVQLVGFDF